MRILVTGGAGFIGSHLVDRLMEENHEVIVVDNFFTGRKDNIRKWYGNRRFEVRRHDVTEPLVVEVDQIYHLACPASPIHYKFNAIKTIKTNVMGTFHMLGLAKRTGARVLFASAAEVYGDPLVHPQPETYWGHVNTTGSRSCYDEGKRLGETLCFEYKKNHDVDVRVARIFNTYGPRMLEDDGRVVSNFVVSALKGHPLTIYGDGLQTRSFCHVEEVVDGLMRLMNSDYDDPVNIGTPTEFTIRQLADLVIELTGIDVGVKMEPMAHPDDDAARRLPDITLAQEKLGWIPKITLREGLPGVIEYFRTTLQDSEGSEDPGQAKRRKT